MEGCKTLGSVCGCKTLGSVCGGGTLGSVGGCGMTGGVMAGSVDESGWVSLNFFKTSSKSAWAVFLIFSRIS